MKFTELRTLEKHLSSAGEHLSAVYLVLAKDDVAREEAVLLLKKHLIKEGEFKELDGRSTSLSYLSESLFTLPMFASHRTLHISHLEKVAKEGQEKILSALTPSSDKLNIILSASTLRANTNFYKALENEGVILSIAEEKPWEKEKNAVVRVVKLVEDCGKKISPQAATALAKQGGAFLANEVEKLVLYCDGRKEITLEDVKKLSIDVLDEDLFQFGDAILKQDIIKALQIAKGLLENNTPLLSLLRLLRSQVQRLMMILSYRGNKDQIQALYPWMRGGILSKNQQLASELGEEKCRQTLLMIDETERHAKNSQGDHKWLLMRLVARCTK